MEAENITSCDNAFVTNIVSAQSAHRTSPGSFALCESEATATNVLSARQRQSAQPERKSTKRHDDPFIFQGINRVLIFIR
ncbi:hypothetical protein ACQKNB_03470 [Lysinibacillus xylanilyticus]|uniref:hypothetical protein n=1 Tax=Lysinibacillus xylanilyticus TaxID=582475 RepID=UPI003D0341F6